MSPNSSDDICIFFCIFSFFCGDDLDPWESKTLLLLFLFTTLLDIFPWKVLVNMFYIFPIYQYSLYINRYHGPTVLSMQPTHINKQVVIEYAVFYSVLRIQIKLFESGSGYKILLTWTPIRILPGLKNLRFF